MPTNHEVVAAVPISTAANQTLLRNLLVRRMAHVSATAAEVQDLVVVDPTTGTTIVVIILLGRSYLFDPTDTTSAHDGTTVLVSSDGKRYKLASNAEVLVYSVLDRINTPPGSPTIGQAYLITAAPTGAWAGHANHIGVFTSRGWEFIVPGIGRLIYVEDEDAFYRKKADASVTIGLGTNAIDLSSIVPSQMLGGGARVNWPVENQTTNTPPAVINGRAYIVGSSPTGVWAGHAGKIAHGELGSWVIYNPEEGWLAFDKAQDVIFTYSGSAWVTQSGTIRVKLNLFTSDGTFSKDSRCIGVIVDVVGAGGAGAFAGQSPGSNGGSSSFGAHCSATGGDGGVVGFGGAGGSGSGGDVNENGEPGILLNATVTAMNFPGGASGAGGHRGKGGPATESNFGAGGGGGRSRKWVADADLSAGVVVTVGTAGTTGNDGTNGFILVQEFIEV